MAEDDLPEDYDVIVLGTGICLIVHLYRALKKKVKNYVVKAIVIPFNFNLKVFLVGGLTSLICFKLL